MRKSNGLSTTLGEHIRTQKGYAFKSGWYCGNGRPIVKVSDFTQDSIDTSALVCIPNEIAEKYLKYALGADDVVIQTVGSWPSNPQSVVGKAVRVPSEAAETLLNQNAVKLIPNVTLDNGYLFYLLKTKTFQTFIVGTAQGAASQASITLDSLKAFPFTLPPLETQQQIAAILSAYDDLIENNSRRIKVLEELAGLIYREWFVNFRFPGHEDVRTVASELGEIPEGWAVKPIGTCIEVSGGGTPSKQKPEFWEGGDAVINWFTPSDLTAAKSMFVRRSGAKITQFGLAKSSARLFPAYSVMMTSRATIGVIAINTEPASTNQGFIVCVPTERLGPYHLYFWLKENMQNIDKISSGATFKEVRRTLFRELPTVIPDEKTALSFTATVGPIGKLIENLYSKNQNLRRTRDLLLPKLISGELSVSQLVAEFTEKEQVA